MIGIRSAFSIRARGHRPHLEAVYMTAPRSVCRSIKKALPTGGRPYVKPYLKRNKNDGRDAEAICEAVSRPTMRFVAVKSIEQQATPAVHTHPRAVGAATHDDSQLPASRTR